MEKLKDALISYCSIKGVRIYWVNMVHVIQSWGYHAERRAAEL